MEFGKVDHSLLNEIDLSLPEDGSITHKVLGQRAINPVRFRLGLTRWGRVDWVGKLYPYKTKEKDFLPFYGSQLNALELNATHYKLYETPGIEKWRKTAGEGFIFCPKLLKDITHKGSLLGKETLLAEVCESFLNGFGPQLGPVFIQLSEYFGPKRKNELFTFLTSLDKRITWFLEVREQKWFESDELFRFLYEHGIGAVITDTAGRRDLLHMQVTIPRLFIRFVANDQHPTDFTRLDEWTKRIKSWIEHGLEEVNFFVHSGDEAKVLEIARYAIEQFNSVCNAGLKPLKLDGSGGGAKEVAAPTLF